MADLLEAEPDVEALSFYPHLLAWELALLSTDKWVGPWCCWTPSRTSATGRNRDFERLVQRLVWLMPSSFFVITRPQPPVVGRGGAPRPAGLAERTGASGSVAAAGSRQVLVGDFSSEDCEDYLARRLAAGESPLAGPEVRG
ncbi:hypothetical protein [Streptomyces millisiae]|uniref:Uncharacterized protein n=1 Tax=Streptomyces millisiae TaxID=3075542 RepID=A0ABU2LXC8_9ACTN|nr:hypothetical protein [Streptomyces sp. DSM 44918]MDT0322254.1 hypothetical protein [Streptomyces sp. DSM 44918]